MVRPLLIILLLWASTAGAQLNRQHLLKPAAQQAPTVGCSFPGTAPATPNLIGWWKVDAGLTVVGPSVTAWADQSGNNFNFYATIGKEPTLSGCSIVFDGINDAMQATVDMYSQNATVFIVAQKNDTTATVVPFEFSNNVNTFDAFSWVWNDGSWDYVMLHQRTPSLYNVNGTTTGRAAMAGTMGTFVLSFNSSDAHPETSIEYKGVLYQTQYSTFNANTSSTFTGLPLNLGSRGAASLFAKIDVKEIRLFNRKLTEAERTAELNYLNSKYGL